MPRSAYITVRVSPAERASIVARSASCGMAPSAFVREAALLRDTPPVRVADADGLRRIRVDLKRIGNNLNQAARALNAYGADEPTGHASRRPRPRLRGGRVPGGPSLEGERQ